ncbi:hypothetical protein LCGC14_3064520, partial [marine sediment metagenome]
MTIRREITEFAEEIQRRERENDSRTTRREFTDLAEEIMRRQREREAAIFGVPVTTA